MYSEAQQKEYFDKSKELLHSEASLNHETYQLLVQLIRFHEWKYYVQNDPLLSDAEYDQLYKALGKTESENPSWITNESPSQRVSSDLTDSFSAVSHFSPMLSLDNANSAEDLRGFDERLRRYLGLDQSAEIEYCVEPKYDGGTLVLVYEDDVLVRAATRGNGSQGDDITANARVIRTVPLSADMKSKGWTRMELRGEALMSKAHFHKLNDLREKEGQSLFANPRNASTGGLRMKDPEETQERGLELFIFQLAYLESTDDSLQYLTHSESLDILDGLGFKTPREERCTFPTIEGVIDYCNEWAEERENYPYEIDGMVIKANQFEIQDRSGNTAHHPRWAIAYKFKAKQATTKLIDIEYQVGKVGSITPVAKLDPVQLAGVTVSSVSLHNADFITARDLHIGDTVLVERAGDVIPYIVKAFPELRDGTEKKVVFPHACPFAPESDPVLLTREENEVIWRCIDCTCGKQSLQKIIYHVSKPAMNIDGLGKSLVEKFVDLGWIKDIADVYNLDYVAVSELDGLGDRSAGKLELAINAAKKNPIHRLLHSLSLHHLGAKASKIIAAEINHVLDLPKWTEEDFSAIKDIGPVLSKNMVEYFKNEQNIELLRKMESCGVNLHQLEADKPLVHSADAALLGKSILFTGSLQQMGRKEAQAMAEKAGAKNISAVSSKLNILVVGEKAGSKLKKAQSIGTVEILTEQEFIDLVK